MTKSANDNMMTSLHLIRLMLVDLPAWRKTEMQNLNVGCVYRAQSLHTSGALITLAYRNFVTAIRDEPAIQQ